MAESILESTKKLLLLIEDDSFDLDVITHINSAFSILAQIGVGPVSGFMIVDASSTWEDFAVPPVLLNMAKTYVFLKVKVNFDQPTSSYGLTAVNEELRQMEWRMQVAAETAASTATP